MKLSKRVSFGSTFVSLAFVSCGVHDSLNSTPQNSSLAKITIGSYNVENFWDNDAANTADPYPTFDSKFSNWTSEKMFNAKALKVAEAIALAGSPDILALQEIESGQNRSRSLEIIAPLLQKQGYKFFALGKQTGSNPTSVTTAFVSKFPITLEASIPFGNDSSARDPQIIEVNVNGVPVRLYNSHWKSKSGGNTPKAEASRMEIAKLIKADIAKVRAQRPTLDVLMMGDFNSEYNESELHKYQTGVQEGLESTGDERFMLQAASTSKVYNLWFELPVAARCSYWYGGKRGCIDHILLTDSVFDNSGLRLVPNSFHVVGMRKGPESKLINGDGSPLRWQTRSEKRGNETFTRHMGLGYSDHLPIVAEFFVQPLNTNPVKVAVANPSTTDRPPATVNPDIDATCKSSQRLLNLQTVDFTNPQVFAQCFALQKGSCTLAATGTYAAPLKLVINGKDIGISLLGAFSTAANDLKILEKAVGKRLTAIRGRLGMIDGSLVIFASSLKDIQVQ